MWDAEGRTLIGRLEPHPPNNDPAKARLNIRGLKDEIQFLVEIDPIQTQPIMQIGYRDRKEHLMTITANGNIGIGEGTSKSKNILTVQRNSETDPIADSWTTYSSRRWKTNIKPIENALDKVQRLSGVAFDWKKNGEHDVGLIAEDVSQVVPEAVAFEPNGKDAKSLDYARLVPILIEAIKEQQKQIEELRASR
jgi:hypothetical protein